MNIHKHEQNLKELLNTGLCRKTGNKAREYFEALDVHNAAATLIKAEKLKEPQKQYMNKTHYPGVYVISRKKKDKQMKLGEAHGNGGLFDRIRNQYNIRYVCQ